MLLIYVSKGIIDYQLIFRQRGFNYQEVKKLAWLNAGAMTLNDKGVAQVSKNLSLFSGTMLAWSISTMSKTLEKK